MAVSTHGLTPDLAAAVAEAFRESDVAATAIVGLDLAVGSQLGALPQAEWNGLIATLRAAFFVLQAEAQALVERADGGCLLVVVPAHALRTSRGCGLAAVGGSFFITVAQVAAAELGPHGIRVNVVAYGPLDGSVPSRVAEAVPLGRLTRPADVAATCLLLAGPGAGHVTGAVVPVDGGYAITKAGGGSPFVR